MDIELPENARKFRFYNGWWHYGWRIWFGNLGLVLLYLCVRPWKRDTNG
jgi:hypothetical protein